MANFFIKRPIFAIVVALVVPLQGCWLYFPCPWTATPALHRLRFP